MYAKIQLAGFLSFPFDDRKQTDRMDKIMSLPFPSILSQKFRFQSSQIIEIMLRRLLLGKPGRCTNSGIKALKIALHGLTENFNRFFDDFFDGGLVE